MSDLMRGYGRGLAIAFFGAVALWGLLLIVLPQLTMVDQALRAPLRQLDSNIADTLAIDAATCAQILERYETPEPEAGGSSGGAGGIAIPSPSTTAPSGGIAIPSPSTTAPGAPSAGGLGIPSIGSTATAGARPYILQCDRTTTEIRLVRGDAEAATTLAEEYGLDTLSVDPEAPIADQIAAAARIQEIGEGLAAELRAAEATVFPYSFDNFEQLVLARAIPLDPASKAADDAAISSQIYSLIGLRFVDEEGVVHKRLTLITLVRTLFFAVCATALCLVVCYPVAYKLALGTSEEKAVWLFVGLVIPYAIVELMRVYAWLSIIDNNGILNELLDALGVIDLSADEGIAFKRSPLTVFVVIVYTYILFMVFPIVNVMSTLDKSQVEAARDLGAAPWRVHARVIIPHTKPGIAVGCITAFMLSAGAFSVPRIISRGLQGEWFSQTIYNKFFESGNSNVGAAYAFAFILCCFAIVAVFMWIMRARLKDFVRA